MIRTLLTGLVDYAGLFPPASLSMPDAAGNYAAYRSGPHAYALGRFVVPVARLEEIEAQLSQDPGYPWRISVLASGDVDADIQEIQAFNERQESRARIDAIEFRAQSAEQIETWAKRLSEAFYDEIDGYFEIPVGEDPAPLITAIASAKQRAKIRTGGVTPEAFPSAGEIARFLAACARNDVPFKATAGLHHPMLCLKPLAYSEDAPEGWMHGFLNVFLAAAWLRLGVDPKAIAPLLDEKDSGALSFGATSVSWRVFRLTTADLEQVRAKFAISFGSCSFEEPIADLQSIGIL